MPVSCTIQEFHNLYSQVISNFNGSSYELLLAETLM